MVAKRSILHVDMDAFYVSVELLRRPELLGRPVIVGASGSRGVVAAASYEARRFGVHSAMSSARAHSLCPDAVFLPPDISHYVEIGERIVSLLLKYTPLVEPLSIDESFLDVTGSEKLFGSAVDIAWSIRKEIAGDLGLTCSVGVAPNKFLAKLASEHAKPRASPHGIDPGHQVFVVEPGSEIEFLHPLPVSALWGVGPATRAKLERIGVRNVGQLAQFDESLLRHSLGEAHGKHLYALAHAIDDRPVDPNRGTKSIGNEETFSHDVTVLEDLRPHLIRLCESVAQRVRAAEVVAGTMTLKVKFSSFQSITRSATPQRPLTTSQAMFAAVWSLLQEVDPSQGVRLLGVHASKLSASDQRFEQQSLFDTGMVLNSETTTTNAVDNGSQTTDPVSGERPEDVEQQWFDASHAVDSIVERFGKDAIGPASTLGAKEAGKSPFGPEE